MISSASNQRLALITPFWRRMTLGFMVMFIAIGIQLSLPKAIAYFIDYSTAHSDTVWLTDMSLIMLAVFVIYCGATALRYYLFESTGTLIVADIRKQLFSSLMRQETSFFDNHKAGELTSRLAADVEMLKQTLSMSIAVGVRSLFTAIGGILLLFTLSPQLSLLVLLIIPVSIYLAKWVGTKSREKSKALQHSFANHSQIAQESFSHIHLIHAFNQQSKANNNYHNATENVVEHSLSNTRLFAAFQGLTTLVTYSAILLTLWVGGTLIVSNEMSIGELTSFIMYAGMVASSASGVSGFWGDWMRSYGATEQVFELINRVPPPHVGPNCENTKPLAGNIEFDQVNFCYPGRSNQTALAAFSLKINAGQKIAIVGPSGAGKSTIANLLLGFYQPTQGQLKFDGIDSTKLPLKNIRDAIAIVEQEPTLFYGTIAENIGYSLATPDAHMTEIEAAAKLANAHDFIIEFESGYDTIVGERGAQLSGGQKQRIAIARALLKNPKILILDEATSALDSKSEYQVQQALTRIMRGRTTIMIAHRFSTIAKADKLVVLDKGEIVQFGDHQQLFGQTGSLYHQLVSDQMSAAE